MSKTITITLSDEQWNMTGVYAGLSVHGNKYPNGAIDVIQETVDQRWKAIFGTVPMPSIVSAQETIAACDTAIAAADTNTDPAQLLATIQQKKDAQAAIVAASHVQVSVS